MPGHAKHHGQTLKSRHETTSHLNYSMDEHDHVTKGPISTRPKQEEHALHDEYIERAHHPLQFPEDPKTSFRGDLKVGEGGSRAAERDRRLDIEDRIASLRRMAVAEQKLEMEAFGHVIKGGKAAQLDHEAQTLENELNNLPEY